MELIIWFPLKPSSSLYNFSLPHFLFDNARADCSFLRIIYFFFYLCTLKQVKLQSLCLIAEAC